MPSALLNYAPSSAPPRTAARFLRWSLLLLALAALALCILFILNPLLELTPLLGGGVLGTPFGPTIAGDSDSQHQADYLPWACFYIFLILLLQWLFLSPRRSLTINANPDGPLPRKALLAAGFWGMMLAVGLIAALLELPDIWLWLTTESGLNSTQDFRGVWPIMLALWLAWAAIFHAYTRSLDRYTALRRIFRWLLAGTILELVISAPVHAYIVNTRGDECYCQRGSWTGVAFGATCALCLFGPGTFLLFLREHRRRNHLI